MPEQKFKHFLQDELDNLKALDIRVLEVASLTTITETMIIATGTSDRHTQSIANNLVAKAKSLGFSPIGIEGQQDGEWILVDFGDIILHVMLARVRDFYNLEKLWSFPEVEELSA